MKRKPLFHNVKTALRGSILLLGFLTFFLTMTVPNDRAYAGCGCTGCVETDVQFAEDIIAAYHAVEEKKIIKFISDEFKAHKNWMVNTFFQQYVLPALMRFTEQMSAVGMQQVMIIGTFLDAKHQLETQRIFQQLQAQAHKDYHPSEDFCWFGTNVRSLAASDSTAKYNSLIMSKRAMARHLGNANANSSRNRDQDKKGRWKQFTEQHCDPKDNNWQEKGTGLDLACKNASGDKNRRNRDIDFTRLIDEPRTIDVDFVDSTLQGNGDEEDVIAMANNLYGHDVLTRRATEQNLGNKQAQHLYLWLRSVAAKRSVAENSFNAIVGLKSSGTSDIKGAPAPPSAPERTAQFLGAILQELGMPKEEIYTVLGERPSYYAQLELLSKKIYQNPDFYANLYDKPANVARKKVALQAIELMLDRAIYESQIRQEMAMSVLLSSKLRGEFKDVNKDMVGMMNTGN